MRNPAVIARKAILNLGYAIEVARYRALRQLARYRVLRQFKRYNILERYNVLHRFRLGIMSRRDRFSLAYQDARWGSQESRSGTGSELRATEVIRANLAPLLRRHNIRTLLDAPCGDWNWIQHVDLSGIEYFGADIVPAVVAANRKKYQAPNISFLEADLTRDALPRTEAILCRDCLVHLSYQDISAILANFRRTDATWLLVNTYPEIKANRNQFTGIPWRRLNLQLPPFNFPPPIETLSDGGNVNPGQLALWRLQELPELVAH